MRLAKEKVDLTWLHKPEYETLLEIWSEGSNHSGQWTGEEGEYGFRRNCYTEKGRGTSTQRVIFIVNQPNQTLRVEVTNPNTGCSTVAVLRFDELIPSPRQFQKLVFIRAGGDRNTLSASKTNLRLVWKEFLEATEKMPVVEHEDVHTDNTDERWLE
jgi:hypothetical protein